MASHSFKSKTQATIAAQYSRFVKRKYRNGTIPEGNYRTLIAKSQFLSSCRRKSIRITILSAKWLQNRLKRHKSS